MVTPASLHRVPSGQGLHWPIFVELVGGSNTRKSPLLHMQERGEFAGWIDWTAPSIANLLQLMHASSEVEDL